MGWLRLLLDKLSVSWLDALFGFLYAVVGLITFSAVWHFTHIDPRFFLILLVAKGLWAIFEGLPFRITEVLSGEDYVLLTRPSLWRYMAAASIEAEYLLVLLIQLIVLLPFIGNYYIFIFLGTAIVLGAEILYALLSIILGGKHTILYVFSWLGDWGGEVPGKALHPLTKLFFITIVPVYFLANMPLEVLEGKQTPLVFPLALTLLYAAIKIAVKAALRHARTYG